jgi:centromere/kinetochore protein ZW10
MDLEAIVEMLTNNLPAVFISPLAEVMMPALSTRITEHWLEKGVPSSLDSMVEYQKTLLQVSNFADKLAALEWPGVGIFNEWVSNAPKIWLNKRRETALDWARNHLALGTLPAFTFLFSCCFIPSPSNRELIYIYLGVGKSVVAQHKESRVINKSEGIHLNSTANLVNHDWDNAWDTDEEEKPVLSTDINPPSSTEDKTRHSGAAPPTSSNTVEDDVAEAWGWGGKSRSLLADHVSLDITPEVGI